MDKSTLDKAMQIQKSLDYHIKRLEELRNMYSKTDAIQISYFNSSINSIPYSQSADRTKILDLALSIEENRIKALEGEFERL